MGSYTRAGNCLPQADPETKLLSRLSFATRDDQPTLRRYISAFPRCTVTDSSCIAQRTNAPLGMRPLSAAMSPWPRRRVLAVLSKRLSHAVRSACTSIRPYVLKRDKYGRTGTDACRFVPLSHETYGRAGPPALALLHELAEFAASTGAVSKKIFMENTMRDRSTTLCCGIARQVLASVPLRACLDGRPVPTDGLARSLGPGAGPSSHQDQHLQPTPASGSVVL